MFSGNTVTVMSPDGKPIQINANALQTAAAQTAAGSFSYFHFIREIRNYKRNVNIHQKGQKFDSTD